jgi:hypothetical protein
LSQTWPCPSLSPPSVFRSNIIAQDRSNPSKACFKGIVPVLGTDSAKFGQVVRQEGRAGSMHATNFGFVTKQTCAASFCSCSVAMLTNIECADPVCIAEATSLLLRSALLCSSVQASSLQAGLPHAMCRQCGMQQSGDTIQKAACTCCNLSHAHDSTDLYMALTSLQQLFAVRLRIKRGVFRIGRNPVRTDIKLVPQLSGPTPDTCLVVLNQVYIYQSQFPSIHGLSSAGHIPGQSDAEPCLKLT